MLLIETIIPYGYIIHVGYILVTLKTFASELSNLCCLSKSYLVHSECKLAKLQKDLLLNGKYYIGHSNWNERKLFGFGKWVIIKIVDHHG